MSPRLAAFGAPLLVLVALAAHRGRQRRLQALRSLPRGLGVDETADRGKVLVAQSAFARGAVLLRERAVVSVEGGSLPLRALASLDRDRRGLLLELHCPPSLSPPRPEDGGQGLSAVLGEHGEHLEAAMWQAGCPPHAWARGAVPELWRLLRIWDANKLSLAGPAGLEQCVFFVLSRMNHSCEPNVRLLPGGAAGELVAVAAVDISPGDELNICYLERNALPMLHFLHLPTASRQHLLLRWGFLCGCPRCSAPRDLARAFGCPEANGCPGVAHARGAGPRAQLGRCSACGAEARPERAARLLAAEAELQRDAEERLAGLLKAATEPSDFPVREVLSLLGRCAAAGLAAGHWLHFWLLGLAVVGGAGRDLRAAAQGAARAASLPACAPGALAALASLAPAGAREALERAGAAAEPGGAGAAEAPERPGLTRALAAYFALG